MKRAWAFFVLLFFVAGLLVPPAAAQGSAPQAPPQVDSEGSSVSVPVPEEAGLLAISYVYTNSTPVAIPDNACAAGWTTSTITVADSFLIGDVNVGLWIDHTYRGDLDMFLDGPGGTTVELYTDPDGSANNINALLDDASPNLADSVNHNPPPPYYYAWWNPEGDLGDFIGLDAQGTWTLRICDDAGGDTGNVNTWTLFFQSGLVLAPAAQTGIGCWDTDVVYGFTVLNYTAAAQAFNLAYTSTWSASGPATTPVIPAGGSWAFTATVHIPANAATPDSDVLTVTASGGGDSAQATATTYTDRLYYQDYANAPRPVRDHSVVYYDGRIYKIGGYDGGYRDYLDIYDIATDSWYTGTSIPAGRDYWDCAEISGRIYCAGGYNAGGQSDLYIYDIAGDSWSTGAALPEYRYTYAGVALNGLYYVIGGYGPAPAYKDTIWAYDPTSNTWDTTLAPMTTARRYHMAGAADGRIIVAGGYNPSYLSSVEIYDPVANTWTAGAPIPSTWTRAGDVVKHDRYLLLFGGDDNSTGVSSNAVWGYDAVENTWSQWPVMPHLLYGAEVDGDGTDAWIVSGRLYEGGYFYSPYTTKLTQCPCQSAFNGDFTVDPPQPWVGYEATFTGAANGFPPFQWEWSFGDGFTGTGQIVTHTYVVAGTYTVVMTATNCDDTGQTVVSHDVQVILPPTVDVTPDSLWANLCPDQTTTQDLVICNVGDVPLQWRIREFTRTLLLDETPAVSHPRGGRPVELSLDSVAAAGVEADEWMPMAPVPLILDDGSVEGYIGVNDGTDGSQFVWMNRFTPDLFDFPFAIQEIAVLFGGTGVNVGDAVDILVYQDTDGDGDPSNATMVAIYHETVLADDGTTWSTYTLTTPLYGPNDVLIGVINRYQPGTGGGLIDYPAGQDRTASQYRSWAGWWAVGAPPDPPTWPPDASWGIIDDLAPALAGNWMVRGAGETIVVDIPWLSEDPITGTVPGQGCQTVTVTFDSTGLTVGDYLANLYVDSTDPVNPQVVVPVTLTVQPPPDIDLTAPPLDVEVCPDEMVTVTMDLCNLGGCALEWLIYEMSQTARLAQAPLVEPVRPNNLPENVSDLQFSTGTAEAAPSTPTYPEAMLWDQPSDGRNALICQYFPDFGAGVFGADDFINTQFWYVDTIYIDGARGSTAAGSLPEADSLNWYVFPDAGGVPAGFPGGGGEIWSLSLAPTDTAIVITGTNSDQAYLDIIAAQGEPLALPPGHYWLAFYPSLNFTQYGQWFWDTSATLNGNIGQLIDPANLLGAGWTTWNPWTVIDPAAHDNAFHLEGEAVDIPWLRENPVTGSLGMSECVTVSVTFDATGMAPGIYNAFLHINSNDSDTPSITLPVTMTVPELPVASFDYDPPSGNAPLTVFFTDTSSFAINPTWDFGDGNFGAGSTVSHTYTTANDYTATLTVQSMYGCGTDTAMASIHVAQPNVPVAGFESSSPDCLGDTTIFTNTTTGMGPITYLWNFGDGITSTIEHPTHTYAAAGAHTVILTATNAAGQDSISHAVVINAAPSGADFVWAPTPPIVSATVYFTASVTAGTEPIGYDWDFGDGTLGTGITVTHVYTQTRTYTVTMMATNACGWNGATHAITVQQPQPQGWYIYLPLVFKGYTAP